MRRYRFRALLVGAILVVSSLIAACGGGAGDKAPAAQPSGSGDSTSPAPAAPTSKLAGTEVRIGAIVPSSGPVAEWGKTNTAVLKMLEQEINAQGGVDGKPLKIIFFDSTAKPDQAASGVRKLASDEKVLAIVGPALSSEAEVAFPVANQLQVVATSQNSSKPGVAAKNRPWAFRNTIDEGVFANKTVPWFVKEFNIKRVAVVYDAKDAVGTSIGKSFPAIFETLGVEIINKDDPITFSTTDVDVTAQVTKLKSLNPDGVIIGAFYNGTSTVLREMKRQGVIKPVIGGSPFISSAILEAAPEIPLVSAATYFVGLDRGQAVEFTQKATQAIQAAGNLPAGTEPNMFDANAYDTARIYIDAILKAGVTNDPKDLEADRAKIRDYLANLKDFAGVGGRIGFNADGDGDKEFYVVLGKDGKWSVVETSN